MTSDCGICGDIFTEDEKEQKIKCTGSCENFFHSRCVQDDVVGRKTRSFRDWKCKSCRSSPNSDLIKVLEEFKQQVINEMKSTRSEINELSASVQFMSSKLDDFTTIIKEVKEDLALVKKENESLRSMNTSLNEEVISLKSRVRSLEQYSRKNNVEVNGIPETPKENVISLVKDVGTALGIEIQDGDISTAHRVPSFKKERPPPLIIQFSRRTARDTLLNKFKATKEMTARQINPAFPTQRIYINEHLSPENKVFLSKLKQKCKDVGYDYAWCREGKFFVRKCQGDRYRRIDTYEELNKLK